LLSLFFAQVTLRCRPDEAEAEHDAWQVPYSFSSRIVPPLLKLAYNGFPLKFSIKEGWNYVDDKGKVGKLRTARGQKTNQILGPRHAKVLLASGAMTFDDNDLAMALSSGSKDLDDRIQELAARVMEEARKDLESVINQDPWFAQIDWSSKKKTKRKEWDWPKAPAICSPKYWNLTRPKKGLPPRMIDLTPQNRIKPLLFKLASFVLKYTTFLPSRKLPSTEISHLLQPCRFDSRRSSSS
jgi:DNA polymerase gamma 1